MKRVIGKRDERRKSESDKKVELELKRKQEAAVREMCASPIPLTDPEDS